MSALGPPGVIAGLALGGVAVAGAIGAYQSLKADDMAMAPSSPGYGDRILSTPKGSISLNNEDTVVAGTNLGGGNGKAMAAMANSLKTIAQSSAETAKGLKRQKPVPLYQITRG
jgi:phage terminase large subunit-like protein